MIVLGVPKEVKNFFSPVGKSASKPVRQALAAMVLAFLLAPHYRRLKTIAGLVVGHRVHVATISRRLVNSNSKTRSLYVGLCERHTRATDPWEQRVAAGKKRHWVIVIDTTYHGSVGKCMENLIAMSRRKDPRRRSTRQHALWA